MALWHLGSVSPAVPPQSVKQVLLCWMLAFRVSDLSPGLFPHAPRSSVFDMWELWLMCHPSRGLLSSEVAHTRFIAYRYASVLDSHVQGISEAVNQVGVRGGKLSEQSDSSCLILGWQLSFIFPQIFGEWLSRRMCQWRCRRLFKASAVWFGVLIQGSFSLHLLAIIQDWVAVSSFRCDHSILGGPWTCPWQTRLVYV